jgi:hypothetical protein
VTNDEDDDPIIDDKFYGDDDDDNDNNEMELDTIPGDYNIDSSDTSSNDDAIKQEYIQRSLDVSKPFDLSCRVSFPFHVLTCSPYCVNTSLYTAK